MKVSLSACLLFCGASWILPEGLHGRFVGPPETASPISQTAYGAVRGTYSGQTAVFKGIPYAAPPMGNLRWRAPAPPNSWRDVRNAFDYGPPCVQTAKLADPYAQVIGSEDCLTLNIWSPPEGRQRRLPVMFWIHGGFSNWGASSEFARGVYLYDGQYVAEHGPVVVVTVNYRLGPLGFLAHPALSAETPYQGSGNYGYMDLVAALKWVRENIAQFGGDPGNVTIWGESGGGTAVGALMASPQARGLFERAIQQSGDYVRRPLQEAERYGSELGVRLGCADPRASSGALADQRIAQCMRSQPAARLITAFPQALAAGGKYYKFDIDGFVLRRPVPEMFSAGEEARVPFITGVTSQEAANLLADYIPDFDRVQDQSQARTSLLRYLQNHLGLDAQTARREVDTCSVGNRSAKENMIFCATLPAVCANLAFAGNASRSQPVFRYVYSHVFSSGPLREKGAGHGMELPFTFHNFPRGPTFPPPTAAELAFSDALISYWTAFAGRGNPNFERAPAQWPEFSTGPRSARPYLKLDLNIAVQYSSGEECSDYWRLREQR